MQMVLLENEHEYMNWVADLIEFGEHRANPFATPDTHGMSLSDSFYKYDREDVYEYFGIYASDRSPLEDYILVEDGEEWTANDLPFEYEGKIDRSKLKVDHAHADALHQPPPKPEDYPVVYYTEWDDGFDRLGDIKKRFCLWFSLAGPFDNPRDVRKNWKRWQKNYAAKFEELCKIYEAREAAREQQRLNA